MSSAITEWLNRQNGIYSLYVLRYIGLWLRTFSGLRPTNKKRIFTKHSEAYKLLLINGLHNIYAIKL